MTRELLHARLIAMRAVIDSWICRLLKVKRCSVASTLSSPRHTEARSIAPTAGRSAKRDLTK